MVGSNIASLKAQRYLSQSSESLSKTFERLASGMRINRASDDAAGLAISTALRSDSRVYAQAVRNVNDGISLLSVAQSALEQLLFISNRHLELAHQAANGSYSFTQRKALHLEANALTKEFNRIIGSTSFNGLNLLDRSFTELNIQAGIGINASISSNLTDALARTVGDGTFGAVSSYNQAGPLTTYDVAFADLDNDGVLDMVVGSYSPVVMIRKGLGNGTFGAVTSYNTGMSDIVESISLVDLNNDGIPDLVATSIGQTSVSLGLGNGTFGVSTTYSGGRKDSAVMDFDNDGILDIVTLLDTGIVFRKGAGDGTFAASVTHNIAGVNSNAMTVGDINGDGILDVVVSANLAGAGRAVVLFGNGNGTFYNPGTYFPGYHIFNLALSDFDGDGVLDLITGGNGTISVFKGLGDGTFEPATTFADQAYKMTIGDLNGDGIPDLIYASFSSDVRVRLGIGDGTFTAAISYAMTGNEALVLGDLNGDGVLDIVTAGYGGGSTSTVNIRLANSKKVTTSPLLSITTKEGALEAISVIESDIRRISSELGQIGAFQSRLNTALNNVSNMRINYDAAASRITDADIAEESANMVRLQILQQAGAAVLAQANLQPSLIKTLLNLD